MSAARRAVAGASAAAIVAVSLVLLPVASAGALPVAQAMSASERAAASGEPVEVTAQRAEYSQTFANPDGTFTLEQSSVPQRVRAEDGSWRDVDTTLERRSDGSVGPRSAVVDLAFSGGGDAEDLLRLGTAGKSIRLSWPGKLPVPRLDGSTATYPDVLDGVDLQLTATAEGYRQVLVVRTAQAATNPDLEQIKLSVSGVGLEAAPGAGGGLRAMDDDGNAVFKGPAGQMWDSAGGAESLAADGPKAPKSLVTTAPEERGPQTRPGNGDASAVLPVTVQDGAVIVKPDLGLLRGDKTVYPVYIDPPVGLGASERTKLSSDGDRFWQFDGSLGVGKCGSANGYYCGAGYVDRMYFEFAPSKLVGKYVLDATFRAHETWSFDCDPHWVDLERTDNISEGTRWPGPRQLDQMGDRYVSAGRGKNCRPEQPDAWVEFNDNPDEPDENLASTVRSFADGKISRLTLMLRAKDETDATAWKRFEDNATLKVTYVPRPGVPTSVGVIPGDGTSGYCKTSSSDPLVVTRKDPMVQARVQTRTQPKSGEDKGSLQAEFWMERKQDDGAWDKVWSGYRPDSGWDPDGTLEKMRTTDRADGGIYRYKARTQSHWAYSGRSGDLFSSYSSWCYLKIDSTAPKAPQISAGKPYTECLPNQCVGVGGPGVSGTFSVKPNAADTDITGYRWRLLTTTAANTKQSAGARITLNVTPPLSGTQVLSVEAKDVRNRWGTPAEFTFAVAPAAGPVGRWHFADGAPGSGVTKAVDSATEGTRHDATLYDEAGTGWSTFGRRGDADYSLWLNDSSATSGYAATSTAAVNTQDSFTVSTWAYLTDSTENRVVLTEPGEDGSGFTLYYSSTYKKWIFNRTDKDRNDPTYIRSFASAQNPPLKVWTHLAGVFDTKGDTDKSNDTIQLFVNGRPQGDPVVLSKAAAGYEPWTANRGLQFGRSKVGGTYGEYFHGRIDETALWQRVLTTEEIRTEARLMGSEAPPNELVAMWDASAAKGTEITEGTPYPAAAMKLSSTGATLNEDDNALLLDGTSGYASTTGPVLDENGSFTASARVRLDSAKLSGKPIGYEAQVTGQRTGTESSWALWVTKPAEDTYRWRFTRTSVDGTGKATQSASVPGEENAELDTWVQVTGIFDAQEAWEWTDPDDPEKTETRYGKVHLYVGDSDQASLDRAGFTAEQQGTGELALGRGTGSGSTGHYLPGAVEELRIWAGAMSAEQIRSQVLDAGPLENS